MPSKKEILAELIEHTRQIRLCGPSDDPDQQTADTVSFRHLLVQFKRLAAPLLPDEVAFRLNGLEVTVNDIYTAYEVQAESPRATTGRVCLHELKCEYHRKTARDKLNTGNLAGLRDLNEYPNRVPTAGRSPFHYSQHELKL